MSKIFIRLFSIVLILLSFSLKSQNVNRVLEVAEDLYEIKDFNASLQFYEQAMEIDSSNIDVLYGYAQNLTALNQHEKSIRYYRKVSIMDRQNKFPLVNFHLAEAYRSTGDYRKASRYYSRAKRSFIKNRDGYWYKKINQSKSSARWAQRNDEIKANPNNLGKMVNSGASEFSPVIHQERLYFSALIADSLRENNQILDREYLSRIYSKSLNDQVGAAPIHLDEQSQKKIGKQHLANPFFYEDAIYFSVCDSLFNCEIWKGKLDAELIKSVEKLNKNINYPNSNNTQPSLAKIGDKDYLFFSSDRKGGFGGMDLWVAKKESFGFDKPINLGSNINSAGNEISPNYSTSGQTLYFSSDWHSGYGGYDNFKTTGKPGSFKENENLGKGFNSSGDDYYFFLQNDMAVFSSNRILGNTDQAQGCCNDLFEVPFEETEIKEKEKKVNVAILNKLLPLNLYFHNDEPDPRSRSRTTDENYLELAESYLLRKEEYLDQLSDLPTETLLEVENFFIEEIESGLTELKEFTPLLLKELEKGSEVELSIKGFASALSKSDYNLNLTERRIESLINYFRSYDNGILIPYLEGTSENQGKLDIRKLPFGDYAIQKKNRESEKMAIYGSDAMKQRKIELIAVSSSIDSSRMNIDGAAILNLEDTLIDLQRIDQNKASINIHLPLENSGDAVLKIYNIIDNCDCINAEYANEIEPNVRDVILLKIDISEFQTVVEQQIEIKIVSNSENNLSTVKIQFIKN